jgi:ParB-like chromosome segregation protein Spo0J
MMVDDVKRQQRGWQVEEPIHRREVVLLDDPSKLKVDVHQVMNPLHPDVFNSLKDSIKDDGILVPILLDHNYAVIDGHNRVLIWRQLLENDISIGKVPALVYDAATKYDAYRIAVTTNSVRRDPSAAKPDLVRKQLLYLDHMYEADGDPPDNRRSWSDNRIGATIAIDPKTVKKIREEMEKAEEITTSARRVHIELRDGKRREVVKDLGKVRAASEKGVAARADAGKPTSGKKPKTDEPTVKVGKKDMTAKEVRAELKKLRDQKKAEADKRKAEAQDQEAMKKQFANSYADALAAVYAKHNITPEPSVGDLLDGQVEDTELYERYRNHVTKRQKEASDFVREVTGLYTRGIYEFTAEEAAHAALEVMSYKDPQEVVDEVDRVRQWVDELGDTLNEIMRPGVRAIK